MYVRPGRRASGGQKRNGNVRVVVAAAAAGCVVCGGRRLDLLQRVPITLCPRMKRSVCYAQISRRVHAAAVVVGHQKPVPLLALASCPGCSSTAGEANERMKEKPAWMDGNGARRDPRQAGRAWGKTGRAGGLGGWVVVGCGPADKK